MTQCTATGALSRWRRTTQSVSSSRFEIVIVQDALAGRQMVQALTHSPCRCTSSSLTISPISRSGVASVIPMTP